ncbi:hypothetical protein [Thermus sp. NMX2.A1]|uniref:hypothetical protein n=1 Tax=Thermus sp. NMX2.A1 TaxID=570924 RepID=UPI0003DB8EC9|nr:hypothetical protein [Thermus sp. NMX2.A1]ETN87918.1 hypothetical protein TNMX_09655 [Thermus sp. NMX2.A1]
MKQKEFYRLLEDATEVCMDPSGRRFLVRLPLLGWRAYRLEGEEVSLEAEGEEALARFGEAA